MPEPTSQSLPALAGRLFPSMVDYPGNVSVVLYTQGCNMRCGYCHNKELIKLSDSHESLISGSLLEELRKHKKFADHVVITGGEPTLHGDALMKLCVALKQEGFSVKLDTNGSNPDLLESLLRRRLVDYVALDWKSLEYSQLGYVRPLRMVDVIETLRVMTGASVKFEIRTTLVHPFVNKFVLHTMCYVILDNIKNERSFNGWYWQKANLEKDAKYKAYDLAWAVAMKNWLQKTFVSLPVEAAIHFRSF